MKKIIFICLALLSNAVFSQTNIYHPFPSDSAAWLIYHTGNQGSGYKRTQWLGDTIINSITYTKTYDVVNNQLIYTGGIRQDIQNEKVYKIDVAGSEVDISVDQHLVPGNPISVPWEPYSPQCTVHTVDSVLVGNKYHRSYTIRSIADPAFQATYIVGVGSKEITAFEWSDQLHCFSVNNQMMYPSSAPFSCSLIMGVEDDLTDIISIEPNPVQDQLTLKFTNMALGSSLAIFNIYGSKVLSLTVDQENMVLDVNRLSPGLYSVKLNQNNFAVVKKIIKK